MALSIFVLSPIIQEKNKEQVFWQKTIYCGKNSLEYLQFGSSSEPFCKTLAIV